VVKIKLFYYFLKTFVDWYYKIVDIYKGFGFVFENERFFASKAFVYDFKFYCIAWLAVFVTCFFLLRHFSQFFAKTF